MNGNAKGTEQADERKRCFPVDASNHLRFIRHVDILSRALIGPEIPEFAKSSGIIVTRANRSNDPSSETATICGEFDDAASISFHGESMLLLPLAQSTFPA